VGGVALSGVIDPAAIPTPGASPEDVDTAGRALKADGVKIAQTGNDIDSAWQGLSEFYVAPEASLLFAATKPVAAAGDALKAPTAAAGDALIAFAETAKTLVADLNGLKSKAMAFRAKIDGDDDWREDEDKVKEHNQLNNDILAKLVAYQAAERDCANKITGLFGGTHFIGGDPTKDDQKPGKGEQIYGLSSAIKDIETPWAKPQKYDAPWYEDVWNGAKDFGVGLVQDVASLLGLYGEEGWGWQGWSGLGKNWESLAGGIVGLVGFYGPDGWGWQGWGNLGDNWLNLVNAFVPYREWDGGNGAGYVATQSILNIGSCFVGAGIVKGLTKAARAGRGLKGVEGLSAAAKASVLGREFLTGFKEGFKLPSVGDLKASLDDIKLKIDDLRGLHNLNIPDVDAFIAFTDKIGEDVNLGGDAALRGDLETAEAHALAAEKKIGEAQDAVDGKNFLEESHRVDNARFWLNRLKSEILLRKALLGTPAGREASDLLVKYQIRLDAIHLRGRYVSYNPNGRGYKHPTMDIENNHGHDGPLDEARAKRLAPAIIDELDWARSEHKLPE
jgi:hypothetical protein